MDAEQMAQETFLSSRLKLSLACQFDNLNVKLWKSLRDEEVQLLHDGDAQTEFEAVFTDLIAEHCSKISRYNDPISKFKYVSAGKNAVHIDVKLTSSAGQQSNN